MSAIPYESERYLSEYLLFHYGSPEEILPYPFGPREALGFPQRCAAECLRLGPKRGLDVGCAVGRSSFELARGCREVIGIDFSQRFIGAARHLAEHGELAFNRLDEGDLFTPLIARVPDGIDRARVGFEVGDAQELRAGLGQFDLVFAANLLCRLPDPNRFLARLPGLMAAGGWFFTTTPATWTEEFTPKPKWLGGFTGSDGRRVSTLHGLHAALDASFALERSWDMPFLIREHQRKFQWTVAEASLWRRK